MAEPPVAHPPVAPAPAASTPVQGELALPAPPASGDVPLVPVRMVNEWVYCPRLAFLEWVEGEWADSADTEAGRRVHARVDRGSGALPPPAAGAGADAGADGGAGGDAGESGAAPFVTRAVTLSSERLGIVAKIDVIEGEDGRVVPVDYKKGRRPHVDKGAYEPERVQVCAQALILEDSGYAVEEAALWFAASRERVRVELDDELRAATRRAIGELRLAAAAGRRPPPLVDSPKCVRCSLAGICLPDEVNFFRKGHAPRPLNPSAEPALPLYVQQPGARVRKDGETLLVEADDTATRVKLIDVSELAVFGPVGVTTPTLHELMRREVPVAWYSTGGWLMGHTVGVGTKNVDLRIAQYRAAFDEARARRLARGLVRAKVLNSRTMLRRNWKDDADGAARDEAHGRLTRLAERAPTAADAGQLLGLEGEAAAVYFAAFERMIAPERRVADRPFRFDKRDRRPPPDPVNALLSFSYALLTRTFLATLASVGFDPYLGFYHRPRHGRPALALDMMEPFRPLVADSTVLTAVNNGEVDAGGFVVSGAGCAMTPPTRKALIAAYERRLAQETTHPLFGYRVSMRRLIEVQCRLLARHLMGEIDDYPHYLPR